ncbi:MAG: J domain-containing protein [Fimbriimonadaceae bacterium]|nr:MAG: J domain-containing protein [Fimbriimonadaceae bacterium]
MREAKRAYNVLRAFVNQEFDRIKSVDVMEAWRELDETPGQSADTSVKSTESTPVNAEATANELEATARTILNVTAKATFDEIRKAYERISRRVQPEQFTEGTPEAQQAGELLRKATWAYQFLTKDISPAERRFRSLEIE